MDLSPTTLALLRLTLTPDLGPMRIARVIEAFGSAESALAATPATLERIEGIGPKLASKIARGLRDSKELSQREIEHAKAIGATFLARGEPTYPSLLAELPDAPPIISIKGAFDLRDRYAVAIVGSRECSPYGIEQAERFAETLARAGITIVSGGARGIDTAAHRGALRGGGRTISVFGCGLAHTYPPENERLFNSIAQSGALVSELPISTPPEASNFPARNRLISGLSLGVVVIEAARRSGALITARVAAEDHGREVMGLPGRVDSASSEGTLDLLKAGGAHLVTSPGDVIAILESAARHIHSATHETRFPARPADANLFSPQADGAVAPPPDRPELGDPQSPRGRILSALVDALSFDELAQRSGLETPALRATLTLLEIERRVLRRGSRWVRSDS